jgi:hypothetical protein
MIGCICCRELLMTRSVPDRTIEAVEDCGIADAAADAISIGATGFRDTRTSASSHAGRILRSDGVLLNNFATESTARLMMPGSWALICCRGT